MNTFFNVFLASGINLELWIWGQGFGWIGVMDACQENKMTPHTMETKIKSQHGLVAKASGKKLENGGVLVLP